MVDERIGLGGVYGLGRVVEVREDGFYVGGLEDGLFLHLLGHVFDVLGGADVGVAII